jgi:hypothetical protein
MRALSIRQPYAELILRGIKTIEFRSRPTKLIGERFYIYAAGKKWNGARVEAMARSIDKAGQKTGQETGIWSRDVAAAAAPPWMVELANALRLFPNELPTGVIVGSAVIDRVSQRDDGMWQWHLAEVKRARRLRKPGGHPQPAWFWPFESRGE